MTTTAPARSVAVSGAHRTLLVRRFALSVDVPRHFFAQHADRIPVACLAMARRFEQGGRLLVFGAGAQASDAEHVAVEFVHPVLVGKRALPAIAFTGDSSSVVARLEALGGPNDIAMSIDVTPDGEVARAGLAVARAKGLLTIALTGGGATMSRAVAVDHRFDVEATDPLAIQETHETLYHVLWELVHLFFGHGVSR